MRTLSLATKEVEIKFEEAIKYFKETYLINYVDMYRNNQKQDVIDDLLFHAKVILETNKYLKLNFQYNNPNMINKINFEYNYIMRLLDLFGEKKFIEYFYNHFY